MKKLLSLVLSLLMSMVCVAALVACGGNDDAELAQKAINSVTALYASKAYETPSDFNVLGQTKVGDTSYPITWTATAKDANVDIDDYVTIGEMDATTKQLTIGITKGDEAIEYTLKAAITVGKETADTSFNHKIPAKPKDAAGTKDDPFSPSKVVEIAAGLESGAIYGAPTRVYVSGEIAATGNGTYYPGYVGWIYIVDEYEEGDGEDSADAVCLYKTPLDPNGPLTNYSELKLGAKITVSGYIKNYNGTAELDSYNGDDIKCEYLEKEELTPEQKISLALSEVSDSLIVREAGDIDLPASTLGDVTFTWSTTDTTYTIANNKLHVAALPAEDATVTAKVSASCGAATPSTKTVTITIKAAKQAAGDTVTFDFSEACDKTTGVELTAETALALFNNASATETLLTSVETTKVYNGTGTGGGRPDTKGILKLGTGTVNGTFTLTFSKAVVKVEIVAHDFYKTSASNPTNNGRSLTVNGKKEVLPYNETATGETLTYEIAASTVVTVEAAPRAYIWSIKVTFSDVEVSDNDMANNAANTFTLSKTSYNAVGTYDLPASHAGATITWAVEAANDYVSIKEGKLSVDSLPEADRTVTLVATFHYGEDGSATKNVEITVAPAPVVDAFDHAGTEADPFSVADVQKILATLSTGETYQQNGANAKVYIEGYVTNPGQGGNYYSKVYIADDKDATQAQSVLIWTVNLSDALAGTVLKVGDKIVVNAYIKIHTDGTKEIAGGTNPDYAYIVDYVPADGSEQPGGDEDETNYGSLEAPLSVEDALDLANKQCKIGGASNTKQVVYAIGVVVEIGQGGNYYSGVKLQDSDDDSIVIAIATLNLRDGVAAINVGDEIIVCGYIRVNNNTQELEFGSANSTYVYVEKNLTNSGSEQPSTGCTCPDCTVEDCECTDCDNCECDYCDHDDDNGGEDETPNYGTKEAPLTVEQALALAAKECLNNNDVTKQIVWMKGILTNVPTDKGSYYQDLYLADEGKLGITIQVYTVNLGDGVAVPAPNDELLVCGYIKNYNGTIEFASNSGTNVKIESNTRGLSTITLGDHTNATVTGIPADGKETNGETVTLTVTAEAGKKIVSVKVNGVELTAGEDGNYTFTVAGNATITVEAIDENAKEAEEIVALTFASGANGDPNVSSYTKDWEAKRGDYTWSIYGFNNNNNGWAFIKTGHKTTAVVGMITTQMAEVLTKVIVTIDSSSKSYMASKVNSFRLEVSKSGEFEAESAEDIVAKVELNIATGVNEFAIPAAQQGENLYYRIVVDCQTDVSDNGFVVVNKIAYWGYAAEGNGDNNGDDDGDDDGDDNNQGGGDVTEEAILTLTRNSLFPGLSGTSYGTYDGSHDVGSYSVTTSNVLGNKYGGYDVLQFKASAGYLTLSGNFTKIVIVVVATYDYAGLNKVTITAGGTALEPTLLGSVDTGVFEGNYEVKVHTIEYTVTGTGDQTIKIEKTNSGAGYLSSVEFFA